MEKRAYSPWLGVALCTLAIYIGIPAARSIQKLVAAHLGRSFFGIMVIAAVAICLAGVLYVLIVRLKVRSAANTIWLVGVAGFYVLLTIRRWKVPEEAVHFLEYGLLGYFLFRALSRSVRDWTVYLDAMAVGSLIGFVDEIIQWMIPGRYWDFRDAGFNILSGALFQIAVWKGIRPRVISEAVSPRSQKRLFALLGANLMLIGFCLSNTPNLVAWYTAKIPALAFLQKEEPMHEILHEHRDAEIGIFYSRLTRAELNRTDEKRAGEFGRILSDWKERDYDDFLRMFSPLHNPFLHEMRVHLFRRDKMSAEGEAASLLDRGIGPLPGKIMPQESGITETRSRALLAAYKENRILEKYFGRTMERSGYAWPADRKAAIAARIDTAEPYKSPVSAAGGGFLGRLKTGFVWIFIVLCLLVLALFGSRLGSVRKSSIPGQRLGRG